MHLGEFNCTWCFVLVIPAGNYHIVEDSGKRKHSGIAFELTV